MDIILSQNVTCIDRNAYKEGSNRSLWQIANMETNIEIE